MKITMSTILVFMISTAQAFAGTPQQIGAWSVIPATDNHSNAVLIQTASDSAGAKLDLICRKGKIWKVVVETSIPLQEDAVRKFSAGLSAIGPKLTNGVVPMIWSNTVSLIWLLTAPVTG